MGDKGGERERERENQLVVKRGESEQRHCRINIPFV